MLQGPIMYQQHSDAARPAGPDVELLFNLAPLALLILSPTWRIKKASARFLADWRVTAADCIDEELVPFLQKKLHPRPAHIANLTACIDNAIAARAERTTSPIDGSHAVSWKARVIPVFNGDELLSIVLEWHEGPPSTLHEDELVKPGLSTDEAFRILVQTVKDYAIFLLDTKGNIVTWNTGAQLLKGYKREDIIGKHFSIFYGKEDLDIKKPQMELEICMREGRVEDEGWRYRKDGSRFWANVVITAVYKDGVHVGFGKVTRDLTERKSAESRLIAAYEESEKLKSDFLANMSHEIRTPMHGMLSACTLLLDTPLSARQRDIVNIMDESGQVLLQVINDILDYSKLASGSFSIHTDIVGITSIITSVVRSVQASLPPSVHFELFLAPDLPRSVQGDPLRYRQILQNVVGNAAKFTDKGSIRVRASVQSEDESSYLVLTEVTDTGIGVPEAAEATLFTPFMQFDTTTTKQYKGTGLGLSIAKSLTELMGGRIGYRPNPDRHGSIFWFTARFKKIKSLGQMQDWKRRPQGDSSGTPAPDVDVDDLQRELRIISPIKNLLVVEDNLINQKVVLGMLRSLGFKNVSLASNGMEAVRMVRGKPAAYDLVLMDVSMPIMDGQEATKEIRAGGILVPIVAMTAYALKGDRERCLEYGMNDYVAKPVDKKRLIAVLGKWLLRTTDYRKNYEERLAELRRNHPAVAVPATPGVEAKQFLFEVANGAATPPAEEPQPQGKSVNATKLEAAAAGEASKGESESAGTTPQASKPDTPVAGTSSNGDGKPVEAAGTAQSNPDAPLAETSSNGDIEPAGTTQLKSDTPVAGESSNGEVEPAGTTHGMGLPTGAADTQAPSQANKEGEAPGPNSDIKLPEMTLVPPARMAAAQQGGAAKQVWECPSAAAVAQQESAVGVLKESADAAAAAERQESAVEEVKESPIAPSAEVPHHHVHPTLVHRPRQLSDSSGEGKPSLSVGILEHHSSS